jgi:hypothetical protein
MIMPYLTPGIHSAYSRERLDVWQCSFSNKQRRDPLEATLEKIGKRKLTSALAAMLLRPSSEALAKTGR